MGSNPADSTIKKLMTINKFGPSSVILVCVDAMNSSTSALCYAFDQARKNNCAVQVLAVVDNSYKNLMFGAKALALSKRKQIEENVIKMINELRLETNITPNVAIVEGDILEEIVKEVKATPDCAMLVLGKTSNQLSDNAVLPNVAKGIGKRIDVLVTIVPEERARKAEVAEEMEVVRKRL